MIFKVYHFTSGVHVHCRLFTAKQPNMTWMGCGEFTVRDGEEFEALKLAMPGVTFESKGRDTGEDR